MRARMLPRLALGLLLLAVLPGCIVYEYEHELWLRVDGSGSILVTGRPELWAAFKGVGRAQDPDQTVTREAVRELFERSGLKVKRVTLTRRDGRPYLFVSAEFDDVNRLDATPAFRDLKLALRRRGERLVLEGRWVPPAPAPPLPAAHREGLMAVRFHLPSKVFSHRNADGGVERGNIVGWRQEVARALDGQPLEFGADMSPRSILWSTVSLFGAAIVGGLVILAAALYLVFRKGRAAAAVSPSS
jgi:hypothetical protein